MKRLSLLACLSLLSAPSRTQAKRRSTSKWPTQVKAEFLHAWNGYKQYCWGHDDLKPIIEDLPRLVWDADLDDAGRFARFACICWVSRKRPTRRANTSPRIFRSTKTSRFRILRSRSAILGGLLSSYQITDDKRLLDSGRRSRHAAAAGFRFADRAAVPICKSQNRQDERRGLKSGRDGHAADRIRHA